MVFVGANNSGKSNILDCFRFLSEFVKLEGAARHRAGFDQIVFDGNINQTIHIELQGTVRLKNKEREYIYSVELFGDQFGNGFIKKENFSLIRKTDKQKLLEFISEKGKAIAWDEKGNQTGDIGRGRSDRSYLYDFRDLDQYPILGHFSNEVQNWAFFNFMPGLMRGSLPVKKEFQLQSFGENLAVVLHALQTEYPQRFKEIEDILKSAVSELDELTTGLTLHEPGQTYVRMHEKGLKTFTPAWGMSDGILRLLGHLAILCSPRLPTLICFEEPENYIHPRLLEFIVELIYNASENTHVFITTHSPYFVDLIRPEDLFIVEKEDGETKVKKIEDKKGIKEALKTLGLGEMWYSGALGGTR